MLYQEVLEGALTKEQRQAGYELEELWDCTTLNCKGEFIIAWVSKTVTYARIQEAISQTKTCWRCGHRGLDVSEQPTHILGRDTTEYFCNDIETCLDRCERR